MNHCFMSCKHKTFEPAALSDSSVAVSDIQRLIPNEGAPRNDHTMNHLSYSPVAINFVWLVIFDGLRSTFIVKKFFWGSMPPGPPRMLCVIHAQKFARAAHAAWLHQPHILCAPPFFNLWIRLWVNCIKAL